MKQLHALAAARFLSPLDVELGSLLARRAAGTLRDLDEIRVVALAGALLSVERARGHSCLSLEEIAGRRHGDDTVGAQLPDAAACRAILGRSGLCGDGGTPSPLVLDGDRLYLYRFHLAERRLAGAIRTRIAVGSDGSPLDEGTRALFRSCFPEGAEGVNWQAVAAAAALRNNLTVITGGPGTGKTHTVARVLAVLLAQDPARRVAVAAPTGKAAARLAESLRAAASDIALPDAVRSALPREGLTLHRLLGYQPWKDEFRHGPDAPLGEDVIVVDEASMVDLLMMDALFAAVRPDAKVILLGDPHQLASVETGFVLGDVCRVAESCGEHHSPAFAEWYRCISGRAVPSSASATILRDAVIRLHRSWRFGPDTGIGALAGALRDGDADAAVALLEQGREDIALREPYARVATFLEPLESAIDACLAASDPDEALAGLARFRILCAVREGPRGVAGINEAIERWLRSGGSIDRTTWYRGRPVLVTANDPGTGLFNGDLGVAGNVGGRPVVHFATATGSRAVPVSRMPAHETAWAMTVHKAQGSEFDAVHLVLPDSDNRVLTRELLYTGVTRARAHVTIHGTAPVLRTAVGRVTTRASGLGEYLR